MSDSESTILPISERIVIALADLQTILKVADHYYNTLTDLFEDLQLATYEASDMMLDFVTFVSSVRYFSVITKDAYRSYVVSKHRGKSTDPPKTKEYHQGQDVVGMIYLTTPPEARNNADGVGDLNIGIIIRPQHRRKGYAAKAIQLALDHAFKTIRCHRVQAIIVNPFSYAKYPSYRTFTSIGFKQEGVRRCSYFNVFDGEYQDTAYMGVLDTEWLATEGGSAARPTPWDELLRRHDQERVTIMRWEERMTDSDETETVHHFPLDHDAPNESGGDQPEQPSRVSSRATTPDFHFDSQSADPFQTNDPSSSAPSEHSSSPLSIASNWDMMDEFSSYDEMESEAELSNHDG